VLRCFHGGLTVHGAVKVNDAWGFTLLCPARPAAGPARVARCLTVRGERGNTMRWLLLHHLPLCAPRPASCVMAPKTIKKLSHGGCWRAVGDMSNRY
jgi:hypothetical protein